jgi:tetratricopeptide (TPR) repeat protein
VAKQSSERWRRTSEVYAEVHHIEGSKNGPIGEHKWVEGTVLDTVRIPRWYRGFPDNMRHFLKGTLASALFLAGSAGLAHLWPVFAGERDKWIQVDTAHFILFSQASEALSKEFGVSLERFREVLRAFHQGFEFDSSRPTYVFIFKNAASMKPYRLWEAGKPKENAGYCLSDGTVIYLVVDAGRGAEASRVAYHEYTHVFLNQNLQGIPLWFNEGVAEFYSTFRADNRGAEVGLPRNDYLGFLATASLISLPQLFGVDPHSPEYNDPKLMRVFYAESWAVAHYLLQGSPGEAAKVSNFLERLRHEGSVEDVFGAFQAGPDEMLKAVRQYVAANRFSATVIKYSDLKADLSSRVTPVDEEMIAARLKGLLLTLDAVGFGQNSVVKPSKTPEVQASKAQKEIRLGIISHEKGDILEAADHFTKAVELNPESAEARYQYGALLSTNPQLEKQDVPLTPDGIPPRIVRARELLSKAIQLRPGYFDAYFALGVTYAVGGGNLAEGIEAVKQALRIDPSSKKAAMNLISLYLQKGDIAGAEQAVDEYVVPLKDGEVLDAMRQEIGHAKDELKRGRGREYQEDPGYASQLEALNEAVEKANHGDATGAIAILERILPSIKEPALSRQATEMLARLKNGASQPAKPRR